MRFRISDVRSELLMKPDRMIGGPEGEVRTGEVDSAACLDSASVSSCPVALHVCGCV